MIQVLKYPVAIWLKKGEGRFYAFPLGAKDVFGDVIYPDIDNAGWTEKGTLPQGMPITNITPDRGDRVTGRLGGVTVYTASWAIEEREG